MNATDLLIDGIRDHLEAVATGTLADCSFVVRDQASDRTFPQVRVSERGIEEIHEALLGVYRATVDVTLRTIPADTTDAAHFTLADSLWNFVADDDIENSLSSVDGLKVHDVRCAGPQTAPDDDYRATVLELSVVFIS